MESTIREERRKIFRQELHTLKTEGYLSDTVYDAVEKAHVQYHLSLLQEETALKTELPKQEIKPEMPVTLKPQKVKKTLTAEQIRERNITWSLNIGVIFLLIGGLFVATSNWESMTSLMKSGGVAIVSLLFYGLAALSKKVLHIEKTAFAFTVLGSLFLPIFILSLGWFGLLGSYLSVNGEGRFLLGMLGGIVPLPMYILFAKNLGSRLFVWFTYLSLSAGVAFFFAWLTFTIDYFYLALMMFNGCLLVVYHLLKKHDSLMLFTKEFVPYVQANLVLSTLFMLSFFDNRFLYSFNLILTAVIYLAMIFVSGRKEYHFVFSLIIVYGAYQLIEHSALDTFGAVFYALIGFGMVLVPKALGDSINLDKTFKMTSAVISGFAFIYISFQGIMLRAGEPSFVLLLAYLIIAANFIYLSHQGSLRIFPYLSALFLGAAFYEAVSLVTKVIPDFQFSLSLFIAGFLLLFIFGMLQTVQYLNIVKVSSRDVGLALMCLGMAVGRALMQWWGLGVMLILFSFIAYLIYKKEHRPLLKDAAKWILPASLGLSIAVLGEGIIDNSSEYYEQYGYAVNFAAGASIVLLFGFIWNRFKETDLSNTSMYMAPSLYTLAILHAMFSPINELWVQPLIFAAGIGMYFILYKSIGQKWVPFLMGGASLLAYFSMVHSISMKIEFSHLADSLIGATSAVLLLAVAYILRKQDLYISKAFSWIGHCIYPFLLIYTFFAYHHDGFYSFWIAAVVYGVSVMLAGNEWKIKVFLYGGFTALFFGISLGMDDLLANYFGNYEFPITSAIILLFWILANHDFKKRISFYLVPFSMIGILVTLITYPYEWLPYLVTFVYGAVLLVYLHKINWDLLGILPLFFTFLATVEISFFNDLGHTGNLLLAGGIGIALCLIGQILYRKIVVSGNKLGDIKVDFYSAISFLYFLFMYYFMDEQIWTRVLPGILISLLIWLQRNRVADKASVFVSIATGVFLLQPYYSLIWELNIPSFWKMESVVLPWIFLVIFTRMKLKPKYAQTVKLMEWAVLLIVSMLLIQDGLTSSTIYDAIILGSLALLSMLSGMLLQIKSYFFIGSGVLLLNVFLQTRPYWGNMPWWGYLLMVGFILITVASFNEWNKQKSQKGQTTFITRMKNKTVDKLKQWD